MPEMKVKSKRKRNIALIQLTIIISFAFGFFGNFLATSTFRLIEDTPFNNIYLFIVSGIVVVFFAWMLPYLIKIGIHDIEKMVKNEDLEEKMPEMKVEEKEEKPYLITTSDWVTYLTSKSSNDMSLLFFVGYMAVVVVLGFGGTYESLNNNVYLILGVMLFLYLFFTKLIEEIQKRMNKYQDLLERIMVGEIPNPIDIKNEYKKIEEEKRKRKWWKIKKMGR